MSRGWVYVLDNPSMPGKVKIGFTERIPDQRANELDATGVPTPFVLQFTALVERAFELERAVHAAMDENRIRQNREWFDISVDDAINAVRSTAEELGLELLFEDDRFPEDRDADEEEYTVDEVDWPNDSAEAIAAHNFLLHLRKNKLFRGIQILETWLDRSPENAAEFFSSILDGFTTMDEVIEYENGLPHPGTEVRVENMRLVEEAALVQAVENLARNKSAEEQIFKILYEQYLPMISDVEKMVSAIKFFWRLFPKRRSMFVKLIDSYTKDIFSYDLSDESTVWALGRYSIILVERNQISKAIELIKHISPSIKKMKYRDQRTAYDGVFLETSPMGGIAQPIGVILSNSPENLHLDQVLQQLIQVPMFVNCMVKWGFPEKYQFLVRVTDKAGKERIGKYREFLTEYKNMKIVDFFTNEPLLPDQIPQVKEFLISVASRTQWKVLGSYMDIIETSDDDIYEQVAEELSANDIKRGLWTKAYALANGDEKATKAQYIKLRFDQIANGCA